MSDDGSPRPPEPDWSDIDADAAERTPRDQRQHGPPPRRDEGPRGPPVPRPVNAPMCATDPADAQPEPAPDDDEEHRNRARSPSRRRPVQAKPMERPSMPQNMVQTRTATGLKPLWCWMDRHWRRHVTSLSPSSEGSWLPCRRSLAIAQWQPGSEPSGGGFASRTGRRFRVLPHNGLWGAISGTGMRLSLSSHMNSIPEKQMCRTELPAAKWPRGRPRSFCSVVFQLMHVQHLYGPSLKYPQHPTPKRSATHACIATGRTCHSWQPSFAATGRLVPKTLPLGFPSLIPEHTIPQSTQRSASRAGPKSGSYLRLSLLLVMPNQIAGARVAAWAKHAAEPAFPAGKQLGATPGAPPQQRLLAVHKRAYRRARLRASQSETGYTWYRGRWHSRATLQAIAQPPTRPSRSRAAASEQSRRPVPVLQMLSWNAGGLSSGLYQEFLAWVDFQNRFQLLVVQESHWSQTQDYQSGAWLCVHSSGQERQEGRDRSSGILVLLSRRHFMDLCLIEHIPGRLLQVQAVLRASQLPVTILAVYQHVWRTHLPTAANHKLRNDLWVKLSTALAKVPLRHHLILCGDMNSTLKPQHPHVGPASTPSDAYNHSPELQSLIADHDLCALTPGIARISRPTTPLLAPARSISYSPAR